jgi:hypothetical protein
MRSLLAAPVGYVDGEAEFWHPAVDVAVTVASSVGETAPFALTTMLFVVSTLVFIRLVLHLREADSHTSALAAIASCVLPWNHLPLLAWPFVLCAMPLKLLLRWYVRALRSSGTLVGAWLRLFSRLCVSWRVYLAVVLMQQMRRYRRDCHHNPCGRDCAKVFASAQQSLSVQSYRWRFCLRTFSHPSFRLA